MATPKPLRGLGLQDMPPAGGFTKPIGFPAEGCVAAAAGFSLARASVP